MRRRKISSGAGAFGLTPCFSQDFGRISSILADSGSAADQRGWAARITPRQRQTEDFFMGAGLLNAVASRENDRVLAIFCPFFGGKVQREFFHSRLRQQLASR